MVLAFHGEKDLKLAVLNRLREHRRLDQITQGIYFNETEFRGCHLGCITHSNENTHGLAERLFGIEERVGYWLEAVFEGLPKEECAAWVVESIEAIPVGADLSKCHHQFAHWLLTDSGLLTITDINQEAIATVAALHFRAMNGEATSDSEWSAAGSAAWRAARSAARSAESAAWSAESAARSAAASAAWSAAWHLIAAKSIEIFRTATVPGVSTSPVGVREELCCRNLWCPDMELAK